VRKCWVCVPIQAPNPSSVDDGLVTFEVLASTDVKDCENVVDELEVRPQRCAVLRFKFVLGSVGACL
jgi:hypothetical protein